MKLIWRSKFVDQIVLFVQYYCYLKYEAYLHQIVPCVWQYCYLLVILLLVL